MPSAFGHVLVPLSLRAGVGSARMNWRLTAYCALSSALPDLDVIGFVLRVPYGSPWGHRGAAHSLLAALVWAVLSVALALIAGRVAMRKLERHRLLRAPA